MSTIRALGFLATLGTLSGVACAQILGIESDAHLVGSTGGMGGTGGTGSTTSRVPSSCTPGDAAACATGLFCDPDQNTCVPACQGTLRVRVTTDNSGTAQDIAKPYNQAIYDYMRELKAQGGVRGCDVDVVVTDGHYDATVTSQAVTSWSQEPTWPEVASLFIFGTGPTQTVTQMSAVAGKLIIPGSYAGAFTSPKSLEVSVTYPDVNSQGQTSMLTANKSSPGFPYVFFPATDYSTGIRIAIDAAWDIQPGKIAMVYDNTCAYCTDPLVAGKAHVLTKPGMVLAQDVSDVPQTSDATKIPAIAMEIRALIDGEIAKLQADPNYNPIRWLWCGNSVTSCAGVAKGAGQANADILAQAGDAAKQWTVRVIANNWGIGETSSALCGSTGSATDCDNVLYGLFPVPRYSDTSHASGMQALLDLHDKWAINDKEEAGVATYQDVRYVQGYTAALMWRKAVDAALDAGHATPTGADLKNALEQFQQVVLAGMTAGPISFKPTDHRPQGSEWVYYLRAGVLTLDNSYSLSLDSAWLGY
jgi:ABC-type branched-subunit amino acid transport system substrate-binding protein